MAKTFSATIDGFVRGSKARMEAVVSQAGQRLVSEMQTPGPSVANPSGGQGGHMPVRDGFLRASLVVTFNGDEPAATFPPPGRIKHTFDPGPVNLSIETADITDRILLTYTANYSRFMEYRYGFVRMSALQWPRMVSEAVAEVRHAVALNSGA